MGLTPRSESFVSVAWIGCPAIGIRPGGEEAIVRRFVAPVVG